MMNNKPTKKANAAKIANPRVVAATAVTPSKPRPSSAPSPKDMAYALIKKKKPVLGVPKPRSSTSPTVNPGVGPRPVGLIKKGVANTARRQTAKAMGSVAGSLIKSMSKGKK